MQRRKFLRLMALSGSAVVQPPWTVPFEPPIARAQSGRAPGSFYGQWVVRNNLPAFVYEIDQEAPQSPAEWDQIIGPIPRSRRNWLMVGNQAVQLQGANDGTVALFDETYGLRWLTAPDPSGTGVSVIDDTDKKWGSEFSQRAGQSLPLRTFGPTWFQVQDAYAGLSLTRTILCPEGEVPWVLVRVQLALSGDATKTREIRHTERWALRPRFLNVMTPLEYWGAALLRRWRAELAVSYIVSQSAVGLVAEEKFAPATASWPVGEAAKHLIGQPAILVLERLADTAGNAGHRFEGSPHPTLEIATSLTLKPGETRELWFRFGRQDNTPVPQPDSLLNASLVALSKRLPTAAAPKATEAAQEVPWHAALLTGAVAVDRVIGGHTCDQASAYSYLMGFNGAARDPLQHALPLVYTQPDLALSVLRNTCAWARPTGELPYALDGAKLPKFDLLDYTLVPPIAYQPSDLNLWALWLAAEYAAATGDLAAFDATLPYHRMHNTGAVPLREHLRRQFRFFVDKVGRGEEGHVRIMHADWNDLAIKIAESGVPAESMIEKGSSVLNSAMAAWVLDIFSALATRLVDTPLATEARAEAEKLRRLVKKAWNGEWFNRAYVPGGRVIGGADDMWLEVQPWAILCGAADGKNQAESLLEKIRQGPGKNSPLGTRVRWKRGASGSDPNASGIWYSINMTLIWAAARVSPKWADWAWDQWRRMTLASHTAEYPTIWEGTLSGPDGWNPPESDRPGRTWAIPALVIAMQAFPVNNMHSHSQPLLAYLRLLGVEPTSRGTLAVGKGGDFRSEVFHLDRAGHGSLQARGVVSLETVNGTISGGPGKISW